jgi:cytosol alanyl aminopeptidase
MRTYRVLRRAASLLAAIVIFGPSLSAAQRPAPEFRLPDIARPIRYQLDLTILPNEPTFHGSAVIGIDLRDRTDIVWLNVKDLTIQEVSAKAAGHSKVARGHVSGEFLGVELAEPMGPGPIEIGIQYVGRLDENSNVGAYRKKSGNDWYIYTTFTPIDARRAFPCFDEPGYKAPWEIVLHVKREDVAVSNAPVIATEDEPNGMKRVQFAKTQPLASEVVAFAVGPFDVVDAGVAGQRRIPVRIITPRGRGGEAEAARSATAEILARLEQYTGIPYPWDKLDHIAVLDMPFGAVENPGLITYLDEILLAEPNQDTQQRQRSMRGTMAHEMSHQWFGNLVTQAWWDDVWLSEGFATWLGTKISDVEFPAFERGLFIIESRDYMIVLDSPKERPVRLEMHSRKETEGVYDRIIYVKGASVLKMLEDWLGPEVFQRSLHRYLTDHEFGTGTSSDLARAIKQEAGVDVSAVLFGFLDRPGAPVLRFSFASGEGIVKLEVEQGAQPWTVPVCFHAEAIERRCEVVSSSHAEIRLAKLPSWMWPNAYGSGYYKSLLNADLLDGLMKNGYSHMEGPERVALAGDLESLASSGEVPAAAIMKILPRIAHDPVTWVRVHAAATALELSLIAPESARGKYADWLTNIMNVPRATPEQAQGVEEFFRDKP